MEKEVESNQHVDMQVLAMAEMDGKAKPSGSLGTLEDIAIK
jgi:NaMN:DMB phosphoribosyltransferase